jgi:hypothetical protein
MEWLLHGNITENMHQKQEWMICNKLEGWRIVGTNDETSPMAALCTKHVHTIRTE